MSDSAQKLSDSEGKDRTIGQVLSALDVNFKGISASKIRFLEDKGLVQPHRTNTGYRKYSARDVEQLRYILSLQRDQYLPLKVIKDKLQAGEFEQYYREKTQGDTTAESSPRNTQEQHAQVHGEEQDAVASFVPLPEQERSYTLRELSTAAGADMPLLRELINFGLIRDVDGNYSEYDVAITKICSQLTSHGLQPRHLRQFRATAEREAELVKNAVAPLALRKDKDSLSLAKTRAREISNLCLRLHMALVISSIPDYDS
ncbi:MerR family transcriptional regulator [Rothia sp. P6271]|uniref:transcriptional regulator FtsR n=1 Tax=unclassified Rothia (in: high G+C Gram-positive bacteria) TaxID=2689056 RepID=UPI003AC9D04F